MKIRHKNLTYRLGHGYSTRNNNPIQGILVHSTNGNRGSSFTAEENFLFHSANVSAHYLVGKQGQVTELLDLSFGGWHAGSVNDQRFNNQRSIGIECHYTPGEPLPQAKMVDALTLLVMDLRTRFPSIEDVATHRHTAIPRGRKIDPSFFTDAQFEAWRQSMIVNDIPIQSKVNASIDQLRHKLTIRGVRDWQIVPIVSAYTAYGELTSAGNVYPLAQAIHETGWFTSERWVQSYNPAGLGATNDGAWGGRFSNVSEGVFAQFAHLMVYATKPEENSFILEQFTRLSPRYEPAVRLYGRGSARTWVGLNGKWAFPGTTYGQKIIEIANWLMS